LIKLMVFLSRLPHVDREAFQAYYETRHAPLVLRLMPTISGYERNYPDVSKVRPLEGQSVDDVLDWDAVTILRFKDREALNAYKAVLKDEKVMAIIRADEANFLDATRTRLFMVEEHLSEDQP
jgi:hypothetical protein